MEPMVTGGSDTLGGVVLSRQASAWGRSEFDIAGDIRIARMVVVWTDGARRAAPHSSVRPPTVAAETAKARCRSTWLYK
jgi:hypothetical protein